MSDIKQLLTAALPAASPDAVDSALGAVDPRADLQRGRRLVRQRRLSYGVGIVAAASLTGLIVRLPAGQLGSGGAVAAASSQNLSSGQSGSVATDAVDLPIVKLVAYTGESPQGYRVDWAPQGWFVQGVNAFSLTVAPDGDATSSDDFVGKLVVMLESKDVPAITQDTPGARVEVNGRTGVVQIQKSPQSYAAKDGGSVTMLRYTLADGRAMVVQAPARLGWDNATLVRFAEGVSVLAAAQAGVG